MASNNVTNFYGTNYYEKDVCQFEGNGKDDLESFLEGVCSALL